MKFLSRRFWKTSFSNWSFSLYFWPVASMSLSCYYFVIWRSLGTILRQKLLLTSILVTDVGDSTWWGFVWDVGDQTVDGHYAPKFQKIIKIMIRLRSSYNCHQNKLSHASVTNIIVTNSNDFKITEKETKLWILTEVMFYSV